MGVPCCRAVALLSSAVISCLLLLASTLSNAQGLTSAAAELRRVFEEQILFDRLTPGDALAALPTAQFVVSNAPDMESQALGRRALAEIARTEREFAAAEAHFRAVISLYPGSPQAAWARFGLGMLLLDLAGAQMRPDLRATALAELQAVVDMNPAHPVANRALEKIALAHLDLGDRQKAIEVYNRVIATYPGTPGAVFAHGGLARAYRDLRRWDDALKYARLRAGFAGYPRCDMFQLMAGMMLAEKGDFAAAEEVYRKVISTYPSSLEALGAVSAIASLYLSREQPDQAIAHMQALVKEHAGSEIALQAECNIGRIYLVRGRIEEADAIFARLAAKCAGDGRGHLSEGFYNLAREEFEAKRYGAAIKLMKLALADDSWKNEWWMGLQVLGQCYQALGRYEEAAAAYRKVAEGVPDACRDGRAAAMYQAASAFAEMGRYEEARRGAGELLKRDCAPFVNWHEASRELIALTRYREGDYAKALEEFAAILRRCEDGERRDALRRMLQEIRSEAAAAASPAEGR
jgi:tetratricopeptide (TPR) repeat protein